MVGEKITDEGLYKYERTIKSKIIYKGELQMPPLFNDAEEEE